MAIANDKKKSGTPASVRIDNLAERLRNDFLEFQQDIESADALTGKTLERINLMSWILLDLVGRVSNDPDQSFVRVHQAFYLLRLDEHIPGRPIGSRT